MKKHLFLRLIILSLSALMVLGMAACSAPAASPSAAASAPAVQASPTTSQTSAPSAPAATDNKPVTLKMIEHSNQGTNAAVKALNDAFMKLYPNITIDDTIVGTDQKAQLLQTRIASGDVDIFEFSCFAITNPDWAKGLDTSAAVQYIQAGDVMDLTGQPFVANWDPAAVRDADTYNGKVYCLDIGKVAYNGIFYNKAMFAKYNLQVPQTWDQFIDICKTLQSNNIAPMTAGGKDGWPIDMMWNAFVNANEPDPAGFAKALWTGDRKFNDPQTLKLFDKMAEFASYFEKGVTAVDYASVVGRFVSGKAAMLPDGTWQGATITAADPNFQFGYFCIPGDTQGAQPMQLAGKYDIGYAGYAKTQNPDAVLKWLAFLSQKDNYTNFVNTNGFIPTMQGITLSNAFLNSLAPLDVNFQINWENLNFNPKGLGQYGGFAISQLKVLGGSIDTPEELADKAQADWDAALAALK